MHNLVILLRVPNKLSEHIEGIRLHIAFLLHHVKSFRSLYRVINWPARVAAAIVNLVNKLNTVILRTPSSFPGTSILLWTFCKF